LGGRNGPDIRDDVGLPAEYGSIAIRPAGGA